MYWANGVAQRDIAERQADVVGCGGASSTSELVQCLRDVPAEELVTSGDRAFKVTPRELVSGCGEAGPLLQTLLYSVHLRICTMYMINNFHIKQLLSWQVCCLNYIQQGKDNCIEIIKISPKSKPLQSSRYDPPGQYLLGSKNT